MAINWGALGDLGTAAANASFGRAQGRQAEAQYGLDRNRQIMDRLGAELAMRRGDTSDALRGSFLQNVQDATIAAPAGVTVPRIAGGVRPSAIGNRADIGALLERNARARLASPTPTYASVDADTPQAPQAGKMDKFLNTFGTIAPMMSKVAPMLGIGKGAAAMAAHEAAHAGGAAAAGAAGSGGLMGTLGTIAPLASIPFLVSSMIKQDPTVTAVEQARERMVASGTWTPQLQQEFLRTKNPFQKDRRAAYAAFAQKIGAM